MQKLLVNLTLIDRIEHIYTCSNLFYMMQLSENQMHIPHLSQKEKNVKISNSEKTIKRFSLKVRRFLVTLRTSFFNKKAIFT